MKTSLAILFTALFAAAAHAAPLPPSVSAAIGTGVSAANHLHSFAVTPLIPRVTFIAPAAPLPAFIVPTPVRAVRAR